MSVSPPSRMPEWYLDGFHVESVFDRSPDAEFIFDSDWELDRGVSLDTLEWRECLVPVGAFELTSLTLHDHLRKIIPSNYPLDEEMQRCAGIEAWIAEAGGIESALDQCPILVRIESGKALIEDGFHRLGLALHVYGAIEVRAICAITPPSD